MSGHLTLSLVSASMLLSMIWKQLRAEWCIHVTLTARYLRRHNMHAYQSNQSRERRDEANWRIGCSGRGRMFEGRRGFESETVKSILHPDKPIGETNRKSDGGCAFGKLSLNYTQIAPSVKYPWKKRICLCAHKQPSSPPPPNGSPVDVRTYRTYSSIFTLDQAFFIAGTLS